MKYITICLKNLYRHFHKYLPQTCRCIFIQHVIFQVERAVVVVDDRGKPQGTGIVEFSRRASYLKALETISKGVFLLSK